MTSAKSIPSVLQPAVHSETKQQPPQTAKQSSSHRMNAQLAGLLRKPPIATNPSTSAATRQRPALPQHARNAAKKRWFDRATHVPTHGQWWSKRRKQRLHVPQ